MMPKAGESVEEFFGRMKDDELLKYRAVYEGLIADNGPGSRKKAKIPHMIPAWENGLRIVNEEVEKRGIGRVQLKMF